MCRTGLCRFGIGNWIFMLATLHLFTFAQGGDETTDEGVQLTMEPADALVPPGARVTLPCAARAPAGQGAPPPRLAWRHSAAGQPTRDHTIGHDDRYRKQLPNGSLVIEAMSATLAGRYQCVASADGVGTVVSRVAAVALAELPEVTGGPRSVLAVAGGPVVIPCGLRPRDPLHALLVLPAPPTGPHRSFGSKERAPPPALAVNVTWLKNGQPLRTEWARVALAASGALELDPARPHDAGSYRCRASLPHQPHLYATSEETELRVSVESAGAEYPPRFIATPQSVTVMEGASVTFDCAAVGNPKPEMIWLNNGAAIDLSDLDSRFYLAGSGSLRVAGARAGDSGAYTCRAHNRLDHADHTAQLHVLTAPRVSLPGGGAVVARERGDVTLRCVARGQPAPRVAWLKDGEPLSPNNHDIALVDGYSLRIQGVLRVDAGMFQCAASSPAGSAQAALRLTVLQPEDDPPPPAKPVSSAVDILNSLISSERADGSPSDEDYLGETSSAFTPEPEFSDYYDEEGEEGGPAGLELAGGEGGSSGSAGPPAPMDLRAVLVKHRFVTLSWQPPEGEAQLDGYAVVYRVKGSQRERVSRGPASRTEMNVAGLQPNTTYQFAVRAYAGGGISPPTETIEVTTPEEEASLGPPLNVRAEPMGPHTARVSWAPPAIGPPPDNYTVHYTEAETGREQLQWVSAPPGGALVSTTLSGLRAAALYWVRVAAAGGAPAELRLRTPSDAPAAPPTNVSAVGTSATSIVVRWEPPPPRTHRGPLTGYKVRYRPAPAQPLSAAVRRKADSLTTPADARRAELTGLDTGTTYQIRVCAINANGSGPFSEWLTASTQPRPLDETRVPPQPPPLTTRAGRDWISVWWAEEGEGFGTLVRGYWLGWGLGVPDEHSRELPSHLHSHVIRGLESNAEYVISLRASNALGLGPAVYATVRTKPAAAEGDDEDDGDDADTDADDDDEDDDDTTPPLIPPVGLKVIMLSGTTAVVYWTDPTLPKGQTATDGRRYVVRWSAPGGRARAYNASDLSCMLDDLRPHTTYEFAVKLIKGGRESAWSLLVSNTTLEAAPGSAPRDLRVAPPQPASAAARAADLAWAPPAKPNGLVTGYVIMYAVQRGGGAEEWTAVAVLGERTRARVDRLRPRTAYLFKVQARNSKGLGPFSQPVAYTTAMEAGEGGGLASATSAWLWASAGGACAVLALAAALALSLCCRRAPQHLSPDTSTYQKSSASAAIKPPDLWIHHDQMELKHMDKSLHSSNMSAGSVEGGLGGGLASSSLTLGRGAEYEPARHPSHHAPHPHPLPHPHPPASLDRRHYVPTYVESSRASCAGSSDESAPRASPASTAGGCYRCDYRPMTGVGVGVGSMGSMGGGMGGMGAPCGGTCERRQHRALPHHPDQSTPLLSGVAPLGSPQSSLASLAPLHPPPAPCGSGSCPLGAACSAPGPPGVAGGPGGGGGAPTPGGDIYACAARERGHYVAYEPLGHYTHRDSLSSEPGPAGGAGSLQRRAGAGPPPVGVGVGVGVGSALHSFSDGSDHSTPTHSNRSVRESSPYKKSASSSPGHAPNRLQLGGAVAHCSEELEPLTPSRSTERLQREMQNLEGLMKDLSAITQQQFHC